MFGSQKIREDENAENIPGKSKTMNDDEDEKVQLKI